MMGRRGPPWRRRRHGGRKKRGRGGGSRRVNGGVVGERGVFTLYANQPHRRTTGLIFKGPDFSRKEALMFGRKGRCQGERRDAE